MTFWIYVYGANLSEILELFFLKQGRKKTSFASSHGLNTFLENIVPAVCCYSSVSCYKAPKEKNKPKKHLQTIKSCHYIITSQSDETQAPPELQAR